MTKNKLIILVGLIGILLLFLFIWLITSKEPGKIISPLGSLKKEPKPTAKPLEKYSFENLKKRQGKKSKLKLEKVLKQENKFTSYLFSYTSEKRKITGLANIPQGSGPFPVVVMLRGYVDQQDYQTGVGTQRGGEFFSNNGFITLAPDFLGYGGSDMPPNNVWEERFLRPLTVIDLLASISSLDKADQEKIALWGHSNGGMIALAVLEITGEDYPTCLWAPVSQFFPYDILYYTYEFDDKGKALRKNLAELEKEYDVNNYSFDEYLDWIKAPIQIHQGAADQYIPLEWSKNLTEKLKEKEIKAELYTYPNTDHHLQGSWNKVVQRNLYFWTTNFEKKTASRIVENKKK